MIKKKFCRPKDDYEVDDIAAAIVEESEKLEWQKNKEEVGDKDNG